MHVSIDDQMELDVSEISWIHGWLVDRKKEEEKALKGEKTEK